MIDFLVGKIHDARFMTMLLAAIAVSATAYTLIMPLFAGEELAKRMKAVASERERIRQRERERLTKTEKVSLRQTPKQLVSKVVEDFNLGKWLAQEAAREKLFGDGGRDTEAARGVFGVGDSQIDAIGVNDILKMIGDNAAARGSKNIPDKENVHSVFSR